MDTVFLRILKRDPKGVLVLLDTKVIEKGFNNYVTLTDDETDETDRGTYAVQSDSYIFTLK